LQRIAETRAAFVGLWRRIGRLEIPAEVSEAAAWRDESIRRAG